MKHLPTFIKSAITLGCMITGMTGFAHTDSDMDTVLFEAVDLASVQVDGDNSRLTITTDPSRPIGASVVKHGGKNCHLDVAVNRIGDTLAVTLDQNSSGMVSFFLRCDSEVVINLPPGVSLDLVLDKTVINMTGQYGGFNVMSDDAVITFDGHAHRIDVLGDDVVARMVLIHTEATEVVRMNANNLMADLGFAAQAALSYAIDAPVAVFDRGIPNATAGTLVQLSASILKGSTYVVKSAL